MKSGCVRNVQGVDVRTYDHNQTKYQDLRVGRIDAILVDRLAALNMVKKTNDTLAVTGEAFLPSGVWCGAA